MQCLQTNNSCPCCRETLQEKRQIFEDDDDDETESDDSDESDHDEDSDEEEREPDGSSIEILTERIEENGYTILDVVSILFDRYSKIDKKYTSRYCKFITDDFDRIEEELDVECFNEYEERKLMKAEDRINIKISQTQFN
jgi:ATP-dependent helicase YprA (DUF1998 family)